MNKRMYHFFLIITLIQLAFTNDIEATIIQILHTNDNHSYLDSAPHYEKIGGVARLKGLIDFYKKQMSKEGKRTLVMDAGDFTEGNMYYMAENGKKVFKIHNQIGYDVVTLGNHDYLMGANDLDKILGEIDLNFTLLAANIEINGPFNFLKNKIQKYKEFKIEDIKIAILGLTTNELVYKWRFDGGKITSPYKKAREYEDILKQRQNDFIIALTHVGLKRDIKLAQKSKNIDLIIGGHSHTSLFSPIIVKNINKVAVPIVQAGMYTQYLGRLILDLKKGSRLKIISYELIPVSNEDIDIKMKSLVEEADQELNQEYGKEWLNEKIGFSDLVPGDINGMRKWAYFITDSMKEKTETEIAIHTPYMNGENYPVGNISRRDLFNSIPRVLDLSEKYGWTIYTTKIRGIWLKLVFKILERFGKPLIFSGISLEKTENILDKKQTRLLINGEPINPFRYYSVAFTEGVIRGVLGISSHSSSIFRNPKDSKLLIWTTLEEKIKTKSPNLNLNFLTGSNNYFFEPNKGMDLIIN
jgi:5'-nucleotidase/UDP-sugar diphosphatase